MKSTQQLIVCIGTILAVAMVLYPPWVYVDDSKVQHPMGYAPIWKPPTEREHDTAQLFGIKLQLDVQGQKANAIDLLRLFMQIAVLSAVAGGAVVLSKRGSA